jgi:integrase/recombinase XerC/integrase/recombinase XerD
MDTNFTDTFHRWAAQFLFELEFQRNYSPQTLRSYSSDLEQILGILNLRPDNKPHSPENQAPSVNDPSVEAQLLNQIRKSQNTWSHLKASSRNRKAATAKSCMNWLYQNGLTQTNLALKIKSIKVPQKLPFFLSVEEIISIIQAFRLQFDRANTARSVLLHRDFNLFLLLYGAGLRVSEACNLQWSDINTSVRSVRIKGKGNKERVVVIPLKIFQALYASTEAYVITPKISTRTAHTIIRTWGKLAGLQKPIHPHALRHTYATHLLSSGSDLRVLQELLGHSSLQATQKYTHLNVDQLSQTLERHHPLSKPKL